MVPSLLTVSLTVVINEVNGDTMRLHWGNSWQIWFKTKTQLSHTIPQSMSIDSYVTDLI